MRFILNIIFYYVKKFRNVFNEGRQVSESNSSNQLFPYSKVSE